MNNRRSMATLVVCLTAMPALGSCSALDHDDSDDRVLLDQDLRTYARQARANLAQLSPAQREIIEPILVIHERAISEYDRMMAKGQTRRTMQAPMLGAGAYLVANDVTGAGILDDVAIPFLALGAVAMILATSAPANNEALRQAYDYVMNSAEDVSHAYERVDGSAEPIAPPGTRQHCIDMYVDCQQNAHSGFGRGGCQTCMDWCMGAPYNWPKTRACDYKNSKSFLQDMPVRIKF